MTITLKNDFHNTIARTRGGRLSRETVRRIRRTLCPYSNLGPGQDCSCGGNLGERGPQSAEIIPHSDGTVSVVKGA